jgi:hypothetical protein
MTDTILLTMPTTPRLRAVATLVLGGIGSRLELPYEKVDDLQLATLSVLAAAGEEETVTLELSAGDDSLAVEIGPLSAGSGADSGLLRILDRLVDDVESSERDGRDWLILRLTRPSSKPA